ncbi:hypothetical protein D3C72_1064720 [compost metagenome]
MLTLRTTRPEKRPHRSAASIFTGSLSCTATAAFGKDSCLSGVPVSADNSRAMPYTDRQCARLGVSLSVNSVSSRFRYSRTFWPRGASSGSSSRPPWSSAMPSSLAEHSMPKLCTPRSLPILILKGWPSSPGGSSAPTVAQGMRMPTRALGAPQTMFSSSGPPTSTWQMRRRSASGCCTASLISPTTMPVKGGATGSISSTSRPAMVRVSASSWVVSCGLQYSRNQDSGNCIVRLFGVQACWQCLQTGQGVLAFKTGAVCAWLAVIFRHFLL